MSRSTNIASLDEHFDDLLKKDIAKIAVKLRRLSTKRLVYVIEYVIEKLSQKFLPKMPTAQDHLSDHSSGLGYADRKSVIIILAAICDKFNIPYSRGEHAYMALTDQILPIKAQAKWSERAGADKELTPIEFQEKYWGNYIRNDLFFQVDLRTLDPSLFEAIKIYVRHNEKGKKPGEFLPPPHVSRLTRSSGELVDFKHELRETLDEKPTEHGHKLADLAR